MSRKIVVVVAGGEPPSAGAVSRVPTGAHVIAANGGLEHARALGLEVETVIGDLDSVAPAAVREAEGAGIRVIRHPPDKDATDLELALDEALVLQPERVLVLAGDGGRLDHLVATLLLLASPRYADVQVDAEIGSANVHVIREERVISGRSSELLSLLALHGPAEGVWTEGLAYPLAGETLEPGSTRGVSNVVASPTVRITVERGVLLAIRPGSEEAASEDGA